MLDKKLTDNLSNNSPILSNSLSDSEIVKALECCGAFDEDCTECPYNKIFAANCINYLCKDALDLINRLQAENESQRAEIERLNNLIAETNEHRGAVIHAITRIDEVKAEAYKECIEKVKEEINTHSYDTLHKTVINYKLDNLLKELVGEDK